MSYSPIVQLSLLVANQIAAGEVVERPASVVKELIENSLDAGATKIELEVEGGGMHLIRVRDNGAGIRKSDLVLAFARHATSKISTTEDLAAIMSLGFRGEALASIASVSRCRLTSRSKDQDSAWQIQLGSDLTPSLFPVAHPLGTTVEVADLFYNTPARRKFLRSEKTELQSIEEVLKRLALAFPQVSFSLKHQQKQMRFYPSALSGENSRVAKICGQSFMNHAIEISMEAGDLCLKGWLGMPQIAKRQADCQYFFVNQRMVKDRLINHVIKTLYQQHPLMGEGTYPCYVLYLALDPEKVDVNVHPTKQEVRFSQTRLIHDFMTKVISDALAKADTSIDVEKQSNPISFTRKEEVCKKNIPSLNDKKIYPTLDFYQNAKENEWPSSLVFLHRYACVENDQGVFIVDLKQAKSALLTYYFEQNQDNVPIKALLFPLRFSLLKPCLQIKNAILNLMKVGFQLRMEDNEILLLGQPSLLQEELSQALLEKLIHQVANANLVDIPTILGKDLGQMIGDTLCPFLQSLLSEWITNIKQGPWYHLSHEEIAKGIYSSQFEHSVQNV